jgi:phage terminase large subunit-like protein
MLQMALRLAGPLGHPPASLVTTTPRNIPILRSILASPSTVTSRSRTSDNMGNLDPSTVAFLQERYGGTSLGRQELDAELIADSEGALWSRALLDATRVRAAPADLKRVVVTIDPAGGSGRNSDETGIVVAARDAERHGYVIANLSGKHSPDGWARRAIDAYRRHRADRIVAEQNFGGAMVEATLRAVDPSVPVKLVHASRGKAVRAEPVVALFEQGRAHIVGSLPQLEDQLCGWNPLEAGPSPDRLDAMVWGLTELLVEPQPKPARKIHIPWMAR